MGFKICISKLILGVFILVGCSGNYFDEFASKDTPEAIIFAAKMALNDRNYTEAITLMESLDPAYQAIRENQVTFASAYSGRCGLEFISLVETLSAAPSTSFLGLLMNSFPESTITLNGIDGATADSDCILSESVLKAIGDETVREGDENLLMAFNSFAKMGSFLNARADTDDDLIVDGGFNHCSTMTDGEVNEIVTGLSLTILSLGAVGGDYVDIGEISTFCALTPDTQAMCAKTDATAISADETLAMRMIIGSSEYGLGSCGTISACTIAGCP